jgi:hypothetical protein
MLIHSPSSLGDMVDDGVAELGLGDLVPANDRGHLGLLVERGALQLHDPDVLNRIRDAHQDGDLNNLLQMTVDALELHARKAEGADDVPLVRSAETIEVGVFEALSFGGRYTSMKKRAWGKGVAEERTLGATQHFPPDHPGGHKGAFVKNWEKDSRVQADLQFSRQHLLVLGRRLYGFLTSMMDEPDKSLRLRFAARLDGLSQLWWLVHEAAQESTAVDVRTESQRIRQLLEMGDLIDSVRVSH